MTRGPRAKRRIPETFEMMGHKYTVVFEDYLLETEEAYGIADPANKLIRLQAPKIIKVTDKNIEIIKNRLRRLKKKIPKTIDTFEVTEDDVFETFYHELVHIILDTMGEDKLYGDEKFVSMFGKILHQVDKTRKY